jgi:hypothetical protein
MNHMMRRAEIVPSPAVPGRPIGPWSWRTGAPEASATGQDRNPPTLRTACSRDRPTLPRTARDSYLWGAAKAPVDRPVRSQMNNLGTALKRLITQRRRVEPLLAVRRVGQ